MRVVLVEVEELLGRHGRRAPGVVDRRPPAIVGLASPLAETTPPQRVDEHDAVHVRGDEGRAEDPRRASVVRRVGHRASDFGGKHVVGNVDGPTAGVLQQKVHHRAGRVPLGEGLQGAFAIVGARLVREALAEIVVLVLKRMHELVGQRRVRGATEKIRREVHLLVVGLVETGELRFEETKSALLVVVLRWHEAETDEQLSLVANHVRRNLARDVLAHAGDQRHSIEDPRLDRGVRREVPHLRHARQESATRACASPSAPGGIVPFSRGAALAAGYGGGGGRLDAGGGAEAHDVRSARNQVVRASAVT